MKIEKIICDRCARELSKRTTKGERFVYYGRDGHTRSIDLCPSCLNEFKLMLGFGEPVKTPKDTAPVMREVAEW